MKINGIDVQDADKPLVLNIREADAKTGKKDPAKCAAAKAACRLTGVIEARVFRTRTYLLCADARRKGGKVWIRYMTPGPLRGEIIAFDRGGTFQPDDYMLLAPCNTQVLGSYGSGSDKRPKRGKRMKPYHVLKGIREEGPRGGRGANVSIR